MAKCEQCRQIKLDTRWDKIRLYFFKHLFRNDYEDLKADSYTQGIGDGYKLGFSQNQELNAKSNEMVTKILNTQSTTAHSGQGSSVYHNEDRHAIVKRPANKPQRAKGNPRRN